MSLCEATLDDVATWERTWRPVLEAHQRPEAAWPWREHIDRARREADHLALAIRRGADLEALISLRLGRGESQLSPGSDLVYIEYVGVAPSHLRPPIGRRVMSGLGSVLVLTTLQIATECGCDGRVGLHSKPDAEDFYRRLSFRELRYDQTEDGKWLYFEMVPEGARIALAAAAAPPPPGTPK